MLDWLNQPVDFASLGLSRELIAFGPVAIRWYSLAYIAGILLAWVYVSRLVRRPGAPAGPRHLDDLVTWATLGIILGGRIAWLIFYADHAALGADPLSAFAIWKGGMSFHGGMLGVGLAILLYARSAGLDWLRITDYVACAAPIGLFLGRLANFVNGELYGRATDGSWGIVFPGGGPDPRHPSQLYEALLEGAVLFAILAWAFSRVGIRERRGALTGLFLLFYGLFRFAVEFVREPDAGLVAGLTRGQALCLPMILGGLYLLLAAPPPRPAATAA